MAGLRLLVVTDVHYVGVAPGERVYGQRQCGRGAELMALALADARDAGGFDAVALVGDLVNDGAAPDADRDLAELEQIVHEGAPDAPRVVVPGNHDGAPEFVLAVFADRPGLHEFGGYRLWSFVDQWDEDDVCTRPDEQMAQFAEEVDRDDQRPLVVLQHNPLHPVIESVYPYMPPQREPIMGAYADAGVLLSLSAHFHPGQSPSEALGVLYYTAPSLAEPSFRYALVVLDGRSVSVQERSLEGALSRQKSDAGDGDG